MNHFENALCAEHALEVNSEDATENSELIENSAPSDGADERS